MPAYHVYNSRCASSTPTTTAYASVVNSWCVTGWSRTQLQWEKPGEGRALLPELRQSVGVWWPASFAQQDLSHCCSPALFLCEYITLFYLIKFKNCIQPVVFPPSFYNSFCCAIPHFFTMSIHTQFRNILLLVFCLKPTHLLMNQTKFSFCN